MAPILLPKSFKPSPTFLPTSLYSICSSTCAICEDFSKNTDRCANSSHNGCNGEAVFFEESCQPFPKGLQSYFRPLSKGEPSPQSVLSPVYSLFSLLFNLGFSLEIIFNFFTTSGSYRRSRSFSSFATFVVLFDEFCQDLLVVDPFAWILVQFFLGLTTFKRVES